MEDVVGKKLVRLAKFITKQACDRWPTYLANIADEVLSEAYVAAVQSQNKKKTHAEDNEQAWPPQQRKYAYGLLIWRLQQQKYIPKPKNKYQLEIVNDSRLGSHDYSLEKQYEGLQVESCERLVDIQNHVKWLLSCLEQRERRLMILNIYGGYSLKELAIKFKITYTSIVNWKKKALVKMRKQERIRAEENNEN